MKKKIFIGLFTIVVVCFGVFTYLFFKSSEVVSYQPQQNLQAPIEIPSKGLLPFDEALKLEKPMVVMFYVDWCGYCRRYMPVLGEIASKYGDKYSFAVINCDLPEYQQMIKKYNIMGFPTLYVMDKTLDYEFALNPVVTLNKELMFESLDKYYLLRQKALK